MDITVRPCSETDIAPLRTLFLHECHCQFVHNKCHEYRWADNFLIHVSNIVAGYGSTWGHLNRAERNCIFEFYLLPSFRAEGDIAFQKLRELSKAPFVMAQTNDVLLQAMAFQYAGDLRPEAILFEDHHLTHHPCPGTVFRARLPTDDIPDELTGYVLEREGKIIGTGGFVFNYNLPYIDMFMQVQEDFQRQGFGTCIIEELKNEAYRLHRQPAARCNIHNTASKATLLKAGMRICGFLLLGTLKG